MGDKESRIYASTVIGGATKDEKARVDRVLFDLRLGMPEDAAILVRKFWCAVNDNYLLARPFRRSLSMSLRLLADDVDNYFERMPATEFNEIKARGGKP